MPVQAQIAGFGGSRQLDGAQCSSSTNLYGGSCCMYYWYQEAVLAQQCVPGTTWLASAHLVMFDPRTRSSPLSSLDLGRPNFLDLTGAASQPEVSSQHSCGTCLLGTLPWCRRAWNPKKKEKKRSGKQTLHCKHMHGPSKQSHGDMTCTMCYV